MNKEQQEAYDKAQIMLAFARGEKVQCLGCGGEWYTSINYSWNCPASDYRIAPKPIEVWLWRNINGTLYYKAYKDKDECFCAAEAFTSHGKPVLFREVTE